MRIEEKMWDYLLDNYYATTETLEIVTCINGYCTETLKDILYATSGYRDFDQLEEDFYEEEQWTI